MARTKQSALKRTGSSSSLRENRPIKMKRSSERDVKVKLEPGLDNTARQCAAPVELDANIDKSRTPVKVKLEPEGLRQGCGVTVKPDPDAVSSSRLLQQHQRAAIKLEAQEQPLQPKRRYSAAAATAAVKAEDAKPEHIDCPYGAAAAAAAAAAVQPKHVRIVKGEPEGGHDDMYDDEDEDYDDEDEDDDEESADASDGVHDYPDMECGCAACMGLDDMYDYDEYGDVFGCGCPHCLALAVSGDSDQDSEVPDGDDDADSSDLPVWTWGKHFGTPIKDTPGGYIHWLCREPNYFDGSAWKVKLLKQLIAARKVKIVNGVDAESPQVHVVPRVRNDDDDYWGYCGCCADY